jgi:hypothetical protein
MSIYREEIFGPVLSVVRVPDLASATALSQRAQTGELRIAFHLQRWRGARILSPIQVGMVGINVPSPMPVAWHWFGAWKRSLFDDHHAYGQEAVRSLHALQERHAALARQHRQRCGIRDARGQVSRPERCDASLSFNDVHGMNERTPWTSIFFPLGSF